MKWIKMFAAVSIFSLLTCLSTGCDDGGGGGGGNAAVAADNAFVGTWLIQKEDTTSYWVFNSDGTFSKYRAGAPLGESLHFNGIYTITNGTLTGDFLNPGVGTGEIIATINENEVMQMQFIEHWHTPYKEVACIGFKQ
ncbi:lipocalin family protein [Kiritimatiellaeota bacterium B1221]|nr:lipocalin family protein [Kiritimatiellaeota bacterium B1221]